jgi:hypothetical protein
MNEEGIFSDAPDAACGRWGSGQTLRHITTGKLLFSPTVSAKSLIESCRSTRFRPNKSAELQPGWLRSTFFFALCWADHALSGGQFEQHAL